MPLAEYAFSGALLYQWDQQHSVPQRGQRDGLNAPGWRRVRGKRDSCDEPRYCIR